MSTVGEDLPLTGLVARIREPVDVVLTEGFMRQPAPKFEISRAARSEELIAPADEVLGVMADHDVPCHRTPVHGLGDYAAVAAVIDELIDQWRRTYLATTTMAQQRHATAQRVAAGEDDQARR
jgi:molybdopterin-guanine dinucleotide biosynthesis protein